MHNLKRVTKSKTRSERTCLQRECDDYDYEQDTVGGVHIRASFKVIPFPPLNPIPADRCMQSQEFASYLLTHHRECFEQSLVCTYDTHKSFASAAANFSVLVLLLHVCNCEFVQIVRRVLETM